MLVKISPRSGRVTDHVQLNLPHSNSPDLMVMTGNSIQVTLNTHDASTPDDIRTSQLSFSSNNLSFTRVHGAFSGRGRMTGAASDGAAVYVAGVSGESAVLRKFSQGRFVWERKVAAGIEEGSRILVRVGRQSGRVFVCGFHVGEFIKGGVRDHGLRLVRVPLVVFDGRGNRVMEWNRDLAFPMGYEDVRGIEMDKEENLMYVGGWRNPTTGLLEAMVGSFGARKVVMRARKEERREGEKNSGTRKKSVVAIIVVVCIALIVLGVGFGYVRMKLLGRKDLVFGDGDGDGDERSKTTEEMDLNMVDWGKASAWYGDSVGRCKTVQLGGSSGPK